MRHRYRKKIDAELALIKRLKELQVRTQPFASRLRQLTAIVCTQMRAIALLGTVFFSLLVGI
eukprot:COSAG04_NODE_27620_length_281_cov_0.851648_1_plen_61_part_01